MAVCYVNIIVVPYVADEYNYLPTHPPAPLPPSLPPSAAAVSLQTARPHLAADHAVHHSGISDGGSAALRLLVSDTEHVHIPALQLLHSLQTALQQTHV